MLNAAARVVSDTKKFDRGLSRLLHDKLHWLDVPESYLQARPHDIPLFARASTSIPRRSYQAGHKSCIATSTTFCQPTPAPVGLFQLLVRRYGTHCQMNSEIQRVTLTVSNSSLKQSCSVSTSETSALEVNFNNMRYINLLFTYLLTYLNTIILGPLDLYSPHCKAFEVSSHATAHVKFWSPYI